MGYMEKRRHHKSQTLYGSLFFLVLAGLSLIPFMSGKFWLFDGAGELRLYYILLAAAAFVYFLYAQRWFFTFLFALLIIANIAFVYSSAGRPFKKAQTNLDGETFSLLMYSQNRNDKNSADVEKIITEHKPRFVILFNLPEAMLTEISEKFAVYPFSKAIATGKKRHTAVLSDVPVLAAGTIEDKDGKLGIWLTFSVSGRPVTLVTADIPAPWRSKKVYEKDVKRVKYFADFANSKDEPIIIAGVFGASSWSALLEPLKKNASLRPQEGMEPSWPSYLPWFLRFAFYHLYAPLGINVENVAKIKDSSSDSIPLLATVKVLKEEPKGDSDSAEEPALSSEEEILNEGKETKAESEATPEATQETTPEAMSKTESEAESEAEAITENAEEE